ncbi:MAG: NADH-quinone oxidoreductase subunit NuoH [Deltaproteobacteria bacterium]|nr:NADH-quinone oxidoreductase subunit NuoH [Deltaproteobacteria bacterium]
MDFLIEVIKVFVVAIMLLNMAAILTWVERKESALVQDRVGPNRASIFGMSLIGLLHPVADAIKMIMKEDFVPQHANRFLFKIAPALAVFPVFVVFAVIPFGDVLQIGERVIKLQIADLNVGILYIFALSSLAVYGVIIGGWASNNKYSLLGGMRAASQMISYEVCMGVTLVGLFMIFGTVELDDLVRYQGELIGGWIPKWGILVQPISFFLFLATAMAENKRIPFDLPEGDSEIVAGYHLEYSGFRFGMFFLGEYAEIVVISALVTTLFFGGWQIPYLYGNGFHFPWGAELAIVPWAVSLLQVGSFSIKVLFFCWLLVLTRWTFPRFRYDQVMRMGWKMILPLALANIVVTGIVLLIFN